jgi:hypothetical protein
LALSGLYWQRIRWAVLVLFIGFAVYSLRLVLSGATSCGCFGSITFSPWWTFLIDTSIVLGLLLSVRERSRSPTSTEVRFTPKKHWLLSGTFCVIPFIIFSISLFFSQDRTSASFLSKLGNLTILEPENWIGQELPIASFIDLDLSHGRWTVLLHRHDCPQCQQELPKYEQLAYDEQVALVEVPPFPEIAPISEGAAVYVRLANDREWFVETPMEIILEDGIVISATNHHD